MSSDAQRMVDIFLGAATPRAPDALAGAERVAFEAALVDKASRRRPFSIFVDGDEELAAALASQMSAEAEALAGASEDEVIERILAVAAAASPGLPAGTAEYALKLFVTHNPAARNLRIPNLMSRMAPARTESLATAKRSDGGEIHSEIGGRSTPEEDRIAWFREDPVANEHHEHWHLVYPLSETKDRAVMRRRGEIFFYMHQQMLARFDAERLAAGIGRVKAYDDYRQAIEAGYDVGALKINGKGFPARPDNSVWTDMSLSELRLGDDRIFTVKDHETRRDRFYDALKAKKLSDPNGVPVLLDGHEGSNHLGNTNESSLATASAAIGGRPPRDGLSYYGNHHGYGHILVSRIGKEGRDDWGVMFDPAANIRDPFFWRWHRHIDDINFHYQETLPANVFDAAPAVSFGGGDDGGIALIDSERIRDALPRDAEGGDAVSLEAFVGAALGGERFSDDAGGATIAFRLPLGDGGEADAQIETLSELRTEMRQGRFELFEPNGQDNKFSFPYLWHRPFHYAVRLRNQADTDQLVTVRLFLCPAGTADGEADDSLVDDRRLWIEMDKFSATLKAGQDAVLVRDDKDSSVIRRPAFEPKHVTDLHYPAEDPHEDAAFCECGWPYHLLVPRGSAAGMRFALLAIVTKDDHLAPQGACGSMSFCGVKDEYPDRKPMGYPFDRPLAKPLIELAQDEASFALRFITIRHAG